MWFPITLPAEMRWRRPPNPELSARVELFLMNTQQKTVELSAANPPRFDGLTSPQAVEGSWAWHDTPECWLDAPIAWPPGSLTVFSVNGKSSAWGVDTEHELEFANGMRVSSKSKSRLAGCHPSLSCRWRQKLAKPIRCTPTKSSFTSPTMDATEMKLHSVKLWLPNQAETHHVFYPARTYAVDELHCFPSGGLIAAEGKGGIDEFPASHCRSDMPSSKSAYLSGNQMS